jgi:hypothetical protein
VDVPDHAGLLGGSDRLGAVEDDAMTDTRVRSARGIVERLGDRCGEAIGLTHVGGMFWRIDLPPGRVLTPVELAEIDASALLCVRAEAGRLQLYIMETA